MRSVAIFAAVDRSDGESDALACLDVQRLAEPLVQGCMSIDHGWAVGKDTEEVGYPAELCIDGAKRSLRSFRCGLGIGYVDARDGLNLSVSSFADGDMRLKPFGGFSGRYVKARGRMGSGKLRTECQAGRFESVPQSDILQRRDRTGLSLVETGKSGIDHVLRLHDNLCG